MGEAPLWLWIGILGGLASMFTTTALLTVNPAEMSSGQRLLHWLAGASALVYAVVFLGVLGDLLF